VRIAAAAPLMPGTDVMAGDAAIGKVGSVAGVHGLALLRLDRAVEAAAKGEPLRAGGADVTVDADALFAYQHAAANRPVIDL
jgi:hypothetical protein